MATLEDRLLGEKTHYYCSSSEDEDENEEDGHKIIDDSECAASYPSNGDWDGSSMNTGPKGVIKDWQRYKQLETEQRREQEKERVTLAKKLAITCRSHLDDEKKKKENVDDDDGDPILDEEILRQYILKRMEEMMENTTIKKQFGDVLAIGNGEEFLDAVDKEDKDVTVIIHVFESGAAGCEAMNGCLLSLAKDYPDIKFCRLHASDAGLSRKFVTELRIELKSFGLSTAGNKNELVHRLHEANQKAGNSTPANVETLRQEDLAQEEAAATPPENLGECFNYENAILRIHNKLRNGEKIFTAHKINQMWFYGEVKNIESQLIFTSLKFSETSKESSIVLENVVMIPIGSHRMMMTLLVICISV